MPPWTYKKNQVGYKDDHRNFCKKSSKITPAVFPQEVTNQFLQQFLKRLPQEFMKGFLQVGSEDFPQVIFEEFTLTYDEIPKWISIEVLGSISVDNFGTTSAADPRAVGFLPTFVGKFALEFPED